MADRKLAKWLWIKSPEASALLRHLAKLETRSLTAQMLVILREAYQTRRLSIPDILAAGGEPAAETKSA